MTDHIHADFDTLGTSPIGDTGLEVTKLGLGGAALGGLYRDAVPMIKQSSTGNICYELFYKNL